MHYTIFNIGEIITDKILAKEIVWRNCSSDKNFRLYGIEFLRVLCIKHVHIP